MASEVRDKLHAARCEVHTLRQFVSGKTALVLQRERELEGAKRRMREMEEKDRQRAQVLASVLERTARLQQELHGASHTRTRSESSARELERYRIHCLVKTAELLATDIGFASFCISFLRAFQVLFLHGTMDSAFGAPTWRMLMVCLYL